jgi:hypothetical protein
VNRERASIETPHDPSSDAEIHHDAHPHPQSDVVHAQRPRRQEDECRMVASGGAGRRNRAEVKDALLPRTDPNPLRAHAEPFRRAAGRPHPRLAAQRAGETGARSVDEQGAASRIPDYDCGGRRSPQRQTQWTRTERDAPAGRGTRDGCRGHSEDERKERASHLPITVKVSVAV